MTFPFDAGQESGDEPGPRRPSSPKAGLLLLEPELGLGLEELVDCSRVDAETGGCVELVTAGP